MGNARELDYRSGNPSRDAPLWVVGIFDLAACGDELVYMMHIQVGQQVGRFALRGDRTMFFFIFADPSQATPDEIGAQKLLLRRRFKDSG